MPYKMFHMWMAITVIDAAGFLVSAVRGDWPAIGISGALLAFSAAMTWESITGEK